MMERGWCGYRENRDAMNMFALFRLCVNILIDNIFTVFLNQIRQIRRRRTKTSRKRKNIAYLLIYFASHFMQRETIYILSITKLLVTNLYGCTYIYHIKCLAANGNTL